MPDGVNVASWLLHTLENPSVPSIDLDGTGSKLASAQAYSRAAGASVPAQLVLLTKRALLTQWRDVAFNVPRTFLALGVGLMFGFLYFRLTRHDFASLQVRVHAPCEAVSADHAHGSR
jgi:hypothetical protein